jgi:hypothetical protein
MGMAKISLGRVDPSNPDSPIRIFVNNAPLTLLGFLDQVSQVLPHHMFPL